MAFRVCCKCKPPNPYIGSIVREMWVQPIADYESLSTTPWSTVQITKNGQSLNILYGWLHVADHSTDDIEIIMHPLRFSIDGAATSSDYFDLLNNRAMKSEVSFSANGIGFSRRIRLTSQNDAEYMYYRQRAPDAPLGLGYADWIHASPTLLPASGNSHINDGEPNRIELLTGMALFQTVFPSDDVISQTAVAAGIAPTYAAFRNNFATNFMMAIKYARLRKNGVAVGGLLDFSEMIAPESRTGYLPQWNTWLSGRLGLWFPNAGDLLDEFPRSPWQLSFVSGDTLEIDVWYSIRNAPFDGSIDYLRQTSRPADVLCTIPQNNSVDGYRSGWITVPALGSRQFGRVLTVHGLLVNGGWNLNVHTYSFEFGGSVWHAGTGDSGIQKAEAVGVTAVTDMPSVVSRGTAGNSVGTFSVSLPPTFAENDTLILVVEHVNATVPTPAGWDAYGLGTGNGPADPSGTRLHCFYKTATATESAPSITTSQSATAFILAVRGASGGRAFTVARINSSQGTLPTIGTGGNNALIVFIGSNASNAATNCTIVNPALNTLTAATIFATSSGIAIAYGTKVVSGNIGNTTFNWDVSGNQHMVGLVFTPPSVSAGWQRPQFASNSLRWNGIIQKGAFAGYSASIDFWFGGEIAEVVLTVNSNESFQLDRKRYFCIYRPQNSGDYVTSVVDRREGPLSFGPCGVFNGSGTTVFEKWNGVLSPSEPVTFDAEMPDTITVRRAFQ